MFLIEEVVVVSLDRVPRWVWDRVISGQVSLIVNGFEEDDSTADEVVIIADDAFVSVHNIENYWRSPADIIKVHWNLLYFIEQGIVSIFTS